MYINMLMFYHCRLDLYDNMIVAIEKDDVLMQEEPGGKKSKKSKRKFKKEALAVAKKEEDIKILRTLVVFHNFIPFLMIHLGYNGFVPCTLSLPIYKF